MEPQRPKDDIPEEGLRESDFIPIQELKDEAINSLRNLYPTLPDWAMDTLSSIPVSLKGATSSAKKALSSVGSRLVNKGDKIKDNIGKLVVVPGKGGSSVPKKPLSEVVDTYGAGRHDTTKPFISPVDPIKAAEAMKAKQVEELFRSAQDRARSSNR